MEEMFILQIGKQFTLSYFFIFVITHYVNVDADKLFYDVSVLC